MTASAPVAVTLLALNPPTVTLNSPSDGQSFISPTTVPLRVTASADGGPVAQVQYLITGGPTFTVTSFPFSYDWVNPSAGSYSIQAFAYDNSGARRAVRLKLHHGDPGCSASRGPHPHQREQLHHPDHHLRDRHGHQLETARSRT